MRIESRATDTVLALYMGYTVSLICWMISSGSCPDRLMSRSTRLTRSKCTPPRTDTRRSSSGLGWDTGKDLGLDRIEGILLTVARSLLIRFYALDLVTMEC